MQVSFLIVTKNRAEELSFTLNKLKSQMDLSTAEVLVFIDGCQQTESIITNFGWVNWTISKYSISASPARNLLYKKAKGDILIGLDDDAHPITENFIQKVQQHFQEDKQLGIVAFQEIKGVFKNDLEVLNHFKVNESYYTNDFIGCGFAIKKSVYDQTNGFPIWMTIYGEEPALALEVLDLGYSIYYQSNLAVNHRVDIKKRLNQGRNYFRFEHQLRNSIRFYLVYYPIPLVKIVKLLWHNFKKYGLTDFRFFKCYWRVVFNFLFELPTILRFRKPVKKETLQLNLKLQCLKY